jgi:hypothetical protein
VNDAAAAPNGRTAGLWVVGGGNSAAFRTRTPTFQDRFDLSALAKVHASADYEAAMKSVDRGGLAELGDAPSDEEAASTVAYNLPFQEDGELKVAMLLRPQIALGLLESDLAAFGPAAGVVLAQLARTGTAALLDEVFAGGVTAGAAPDGILIQHAIPVWQTYFVHGYACLMAQRDTYGPWRL